MSEIFDPEMTPSVLVRQMENEKAPVTCAKNANQKLGQQREIVHQIVKKYDEESVWDQIKSRDVPSELIDYVQDRIIEGWDFSKIRRQLGIKSASAKSWQKIMSAIRMGYRIDGTALLVQKGWEYQAMSDKLKRLIDDAIENGTAQLTADGDIVKLPGITKEIIGAIDAYNRLTQGFIKNGRDLGAFIDPGTGGGKDGSGGGVTIVVQSMVGLPSKAEVKKHHEDRKVENERLMREALERPIEASFSPVPKPEGVPQIRKPESTE